MRVCQFRHSRTEQEILYNVREGLSRGIRPVFLFFCIFLSGGDAWQTITAIDKSPCIHYNK